MTIHKLTAGDGYTYLTHHVAGGDVDKTRTQDAADYYTAEGNPPGIWIGRGLPLLGLDSAAGEPAQRVTEEQMRALFGEGLHPDADAMITTYQDARIVAGITPKQIVQVKADALRHASLGRPFATYKALAPFEDRVNDRLTTLIEETGRIPTVAEENRIRAQEAKRQRGAVAGYDVVFAPVKSAALVWALDPRAWVRDAVMAAHHDAKDSALTMLEEHAAFTRTGHGSIAQVDTKGLTAVAFDHFDSRDGDPNPHTHVAISNKIQGQDGVWRALDGRAMFRMTVAASEHYNTAFQIALTARTGVQFAAKDMGRGKQPVYEITGIDPTLITAFSSRRRRLVVRYEELLSEYRHEHGHDPSASTAHKLARRANLDTRQGKKPPRSLTAMRDAWRAQALTEHGPEALTRVMAAVPDPNTTRTRSLSTATATSVQELAAAVVTNVAEKRSTWTIWNLHAEAERLIKTAAAEQQPITTAAGISVIIGTLAEHRQIIDAVVTHAVSPGLSIRVEPPALLNEPTGLRRADGVSVFVQHRATRYTSHAILNAEHRLLTAATTIPPTTRIPPTTTGVAATLDGFTATTGTVLDPGQRALVTAFTTDPRLLVVGIGAAGTGKTTAMRAYLHTLTEQNQHLIPLATSAAAAAVLARDLRTPAENVHKFLYEHQFGTHARELATGQTGLLPERLRQFAVSPGDVILVDEAGMAGTPTLDRITTIAAHHGATIRLLGDYRQLAAVESGGALRLIATDAGAVELFTLHRFSNPAEATATLQLRTGDSTGLTFYDTNNRIQGGSSQAMTDAAYSGWQADMRAGKTTMMSAATNANVTELSARARADRVAAGQVEADGITLHDGNRAGVGDWIVTRQNRRTLTTHTGKDFVRNGDAWHIDTRHQDGSLTVHHLGHGGRIRLPADYVAAQVELLYASTVHRTQGTTVQTAHALIGAGTLREHLYVALTRAQQSTHMYVITHDLLPVDEDARMDASRRDPNARAALEVLHAALAAEGAEKSATETIRDAQSDAESVATVLPQYVHAMDRVNAARYRQLTGEIVGTSNATTLFTDPAWPAVARALSEGETVGWDAKQLLRAGTRDQNGRHNPGALTPPHQPATTTTGGTATSPAAVLAARIQSITTARFAPARLTAPTHADTDRYGAFFTAIGIDPAQFDAVAALTPPPGRTPILHRPPHEATGRHNAYGSDLGQALGSRLAQRTIPESAWPAVQTALARLETAGHDPAHALRQVTNRRELSSARSISNVLAWRLADYEITHPNPDPTSTPDDTAAWSTLAWMLKAQENAGGDITRILPTAPRSPTPEAAPPTVKDLIAHVRRYAATTTQLNPHTGDIPPWVPAPPADYPYAVAAAAHLENRVRELATTTADTRPVWAQTLGDAPADPARRTAWLHQVGIVAAYREQHQITSNDPDRPLGPYIEKDQPAHRAYWHAAHATVTAHHLTHDEPAPIRGNRSDPSRSDLRIDGLTDSAAVIRDRIAADIYHGLPAAERTVISGNITAKLGRLWFGPDPAAAQNDVDAALTNPAYSAHLRTALTERGHLTDPTTDAQRRQQPAGAAHRPWQPSHPASTYRRPPRVKQPTSQPQPEQPRRGAAPVQRPPAHQQRPDQGPRLLP